MKIKMGPSKEDLNGYQNSTTETYTFICVVSKMINSWYSFFFIAFFFFNPDIWDIL